MSDECVFCKIGRGEIPVEPLYQDEEFIAFRDQNPQAPVHLLVIPREHFPTVLDVPDAALLGRAFQAANEAARKMDIQDDGFRLVVNTRDDGGQTVYHLHIHVLGGRFMSWPPG